MTPAGQSLAAAALDAVGRHTGVHPLAEGMSSSAWRGTVGGRDYVVRVPKNDGLRPLPRYAAESGLLADLADRGARVARTEIVTIEGVECAIAPEMPGRPVRPDGWTPELIADVEATLGMVHETSPALAVERDVVARFHLAPIWPFDESELAEHPVADRWPDLLPALDERRDAILETGRAPSTVVHTDLHWDHVLVHDGRLSALLDFGDAVAGPAAWDHACLRYYHGDAIARSVAGARWDNEAVELLGAAFALHKLAKTPERDDVVRRAARLLDVVS